MTSASNNRLPSVIAFPQGIEFDDLISCVKDWAVIHGASMRSKTNFTPDSVSFAPFTLVPTPFPRQEFYRVVQIQTIMNELLHKAAHDYEFLKNTLKNSVEVDEFTRKLFAIYEAVRKEGVSQPYCLGLFRSDYMLDVKQGLIHISQVELNTIASSLAGLTFHVGSLHRFVLERLGRYDYLSMLPKNDALHGLSNGLVEAWKLYNNPKSVILMVVEDVSYNISDQRAIEFEIYKINSHIKVLRRTLTQLHQRGSISDEKIFSIDGLDIAVVYYRAGYSPIQYHTELEWEVRLQLERSNAIKCPSINYHLAGTKKVQQVLASKNILSRFLQQPQVDLTYELFTGLYSLDMDDEGDHASNIALKNPEQFVLKPQREGGGNNIYGKEIHSVLTKLGRSKERSAYILMDKIHSPVYSNYIIRPETAGKLVPIDVVSELGIYGVILGSDKEVVINKQVGHMLRSKSHTSDEGGLNAGFGALDSPFLYDG